MKIEKQVSMKWRGSNSKVIKISKNIYMFGYENKYMWKMLYETRIQNTILNINAKCQNKPTLHSFIFENRNTSSATPGILTNIDIPGNKI